MNDLRQWIDICDTATDKSDKGVLNNQTLQETLSAISLSGRSIPILKNPSPQVLCNRLKRTHSLRGILLGNDQFWADSSELIHVQIGKAVGADYSHGSCYGDARLMLNLRHHRPVFIMLPAKDETYDQVFNRPSVVRLVAYIDRITAS